MLLHIALCRKTLKLTAVATAVALALAPLSALAEQERGPPVLRDTETEQLLREYTRPILRTAGLEKQNIQIVIINESVFNAFVADGRRIFVNYGAILQSETPNQITGVLAHETGHLAGGHLAKLHEQLAQAQTQMIIAMLLGAGALVAGSRGGNSNSGLSNAGAAALAGPQEMIRRNLLSYQRQQEENADRAGVKFLTATGQSAKGMYETFKRFTDESLFAARGAHVLDAPVSGARAGAVNGTLTIMVGGDPSLRDRVTPLLKSYGRLIQWMGPVGSGQKMKVLNNVLGFATGQIASIAIETGVALGLDPASLVAVLESGSAGSFALHSLLHNMIPDPVFTAHAATMIAKDTELFQQVCRRGELSPTVLEQLAVDRIRHPVPDVALTTEQHVAAIGETRARAATPLGSESPR